MPYFPHYKHLTTANENGYTKYNTPLSAVACLRPGPSVPDSLYGVCQMEASLVEASDKMRQIQQQLEQQDQYSTWAKLNQSLQVGLPDYAGSRGRTQPGYSCSVYRI